MGYIQDKPVKMLNFGRTEAKLKEWNIDLDNIELVPLMSYNKYIDSVFHSLFLISDSGTAQEEPALFGTPVIVPRDFTERPESVYSNCSFMIDVNNPYNGTWGHALSYLHFLKIGELKMDLEWLGDGNTSQLIVDKIKEIYGN
jgi:UDP-N-acetylglucosamine 2-epimerase